MAKIKLEDGRVINFQGTPTPQDVEEVVSRLGIQKQAPTTQPEQKDGFFKSLIKSPVNTLLVRPAERVGRTIAYGIGAATGNEGLKERALNADAGVSLPGLGKFQNKTPVSGKQIVGEGLESAAEIASLSAPVGKLLGAPKLATRALTSAALGGTASAGRTLAEGGSYGDAAKSGFAGAAIGGAIPVVTAGVSKIGKYTIDRMPKLLGIATGEDDDVIRAALANPKVADIGINEGDDALRKAVNEAAVKSQQLKNSFIKGHKEAFTELAGETSKKLTSKKELQSAFRQILEDNRVKISKQGLDFTTSKIKANPGEITKIQNAWDALNEWDDFTLAGANDFKQLVGAFTKFADEQGAPSKSPTLGRFYNAIDSQIKHALPENLRIRYSEINKNFADNIDLFDDMAMAFNRGDPFTKVDQAFSKNKDSLRRIIKYYSDMSGQDVMAIAAGRNLAMEKNAAFGLANPRSWIDFFISPKLQGKGITFIGKQTAKPLPGVLKRAASGLPGVRRVTRPVELEAISQVTNQ